jgi:hypothetical protein
MTAPPLQSLKTRGSYPFRVIENLGRFADSEAVDWDSFDLSGLAREIRASGTAVDAEKTVWAFEEALRVARLDPELLSYQLAAISCLIARRDDASPRDVFEAFFRRSVPDERWRDRFLPLFG